MVNWDHGIKSGNFLGILHGLTVLCAAAGHGDDRVLRHNDGQHVPTAADRRAGKRRQHGDEMPRYSTARERGTPNAALAHHLPSIGGILRGLLHAVCIESYA